MAKTRARKDDVPTDEYEYQKARSEYTFAPNISRHRLEAKSGQGEDPAVENAAEGVGKGGKECGRAKRSGDLGRAGSADKSKKRGKVSNSMGKKQQSKPEKQLTDQLSKAEEAENNEEKLYIDVNLGDTVKRIVVRKGDTAQALAANFAAEHSKSLA